MFSQASCHIVVGQHVTYSQLLAHRRSSKKLSFENIRCRFGDPDPKIPIYTIPEYTWKETCMKPWEQWFFGSFWFFYPSHKHDWWKKYKHHTLTTWNSHWRSREIWKKWSIWLLYQPPQPTKWRQQRHQCNPPREGVASPYEGVSTMSKWCQDVASRCVPTPQLNLASVNFKVHHASICYIYEYIYIYIYANFFWIPNIAISQHKNWRAN